MNSNLSLSDVRLNFDPAAPAKRFKDAGLTAALLPMEALLPKAVQWPSGLAPTPNPLNPEPNASDDLTRFAGYDAVIMTWTAAEASALAALMSPGYPTSKWYEYRHNVANYISLVTGANAPFRDNQPDMARYYQSLALYFPIQIGKARVLLMKCGLHMDYDGPATPLMKLIPEIIAAVQPKTFITTGTGGGIGSAIKLGDVLIADSVKFDCTTQFKNEPWAKQSVNASPIPGGALAMITPAMLQVNASRLPAGDGNPKIWSGPGCDQVTTDFFGFDDSTNYYKLQGLGLICDMGDAMVGLSLQGIPTLNWYSIRNASDPQIANPNNDIKAANTQAENIYSTYGGITTAGSVIASWAIVASQIT